MRACEGTCACAHVCAHAYTFSTSRSCLVLRSSSAPSERSRGYSSTCDKQHASAIGVQKWLHARRGICSLDRPMALLSMEVMKRRDLDESHPHTMEQPRRHAVDLPSAPLLGALAVEVPLRHCSPVKWIERKRWIEHQPHPADLPPPTGCAEVGARCDDVCL